jgi:hypothetical protein
MKKPISDPELMARVRMTFELAELAEEMMRQNIRRRHPELNDEEVEARLTEWMQDPPTHDDPVFRPMKEFELTR